MNNKAFIFAGLCIASGVAGVLGLVATWVYGTLACAVAGAMGGVGIYIFGILSLAHWRTRK